MNIGKLSLLDFHTNSLGKGISSPSYGLNSRVEWTDLLFDIAANVGEGKFWIQNQLAVMATVHVGCPYDPNGSWDSWHDVSMFKQCPIAKILWKFSAHKILIIKNVNELGMVCLIKYLWTVISFRNRLQMVLFGSSNLFHFFLF